MNRFLFFLLYSLAMPVAISQNTPGLLFRSMFEPNSSIVQDFNSGSCFGDFEYNRADILGEDTTIWAPSDWQDVLVNNIALGNYSRFDISYECGNLDQRKAEITADPSSQGTANYVMRFSLHEAYIGANEKGRVQVNYQNVHEGNDLGGSCFETLHYSVRLYLPNEFTEIANDPEVSISEPSSGNLGLMQFYNNRGWDENGIIVDPFLIALNLVKEEGSTGFILNVSGNKKVDGQWATDWSHTNSNYIVPTEEWIRLDVYLKEGDKVTGNFTLKSSGTTVFDLTENTHRSSLDSQVDGFCHFNPMMLYAWNTVIDEFQGNLSLYWDDFKLFDDSLLYKKFINLIDENCSFNFTLNNSVVQAQEIPQIDSNGDLPSNWKYQFYFRNESDPNNVVTIIQKNNTLDLLPYINEFQNHSTYRVRVAIKNHPFIDTYSNGNDYCLLTTDFDVQQLQHVNNQLNNLLISPNPASERININYLVNENTLNNRIYIFDLSNKLIGEYDLGEKEKGSYVETINLSDLSISDSGKVYLVVFESGMKKSVKKVILMDGP